MNSLKGRRMCFNSVSRVSAMGKQNIMTAVYMAKAPRFIVIRRQRKMDREPGTIFKGTPSTPGS